MTIVMCCICQREIPATVSRYKDAKGRIACVECTQGVRARDDKGVQGSVPDSVRGTES